MSLSHVGTIKCDKCGHKQPFTFWESINVSVDSKLKERLTRGELTTFICDKCGLEAHVTSDCLYHDMDKELAVWLRYSDEPPSSEEVKLREVLASRSNGYKYRVVRSFPDLVDKIQVFDDNFSDYVIELFKLLTCFREGVDLTTPMYYRGLEQANVGGTDLVLVLRIEKGLYRKCYRAPECLEQAEALMPILTKHFDARDKWPQVDRLFLRGALEKTGIFNTLE
jgi:hypothetical protein